LDASLYNYTVPGGSHWSFRLRHGSLLKLTDIEGGANAAMLLYNPEDLLEKYNAPDSLKCQHTFKLTSGHCLYSDMGRIFCSIVEDSGGWNETVCGTSHSRHIEKKWGARNYQLDRNDWKQNGYDAFLVELAKYGLGPRDLASNLNFFSKVLVNNAGNMARVQDYSQPGHCVSLRFEMDTLVIINTCPHPLDDSLTYPRKPIRVELFQADPISEDDPCLNHCDENKRGFENIESTLNPEQARYREIVNAGDYWLHKIRKNETFRILDLDGNQAADTLFYSAEDTNERYSAMDTIREQGNVYLTTGTKLLSNLGNVLLEIVADTCGRHDTLGGACATESNTVRYSLDKRCMHACRDSWMLAIAEHPKLGLSKRDITHNINFFMNVPITEEGGLTFEDGISAPGKYIEMKAHTDVYALISNCPQLNNPCNGYNPTPIAVFIWG